VIRSFQGITPKLAPGVYVDESAQVIGDVTLGEDASVWPLTVVRGDVNKITIGARSNVQDNCCLHVTHDGPYTPGGVELIIGEEVTIGHAVTLHACTIGDRCLIGMGAIVLDRAVLEDECFIAAGAIVSPGKRLKGGWLYRGTPALPVRELTEAERDNLRYSAAHYVRLKNKYLASE
jgi:carbonic anhydrase/acetyltransferase-like protein (isoleucine patch superfamily)